MTLNEAKELLTIVRHRINDAGNKGKKERYHVDGEYGDQGWMDYLKGIVDACWEIDDMIEELCIKDGEQK